MHTNKQFRCWHKEVISKLHCKSKGIGYIYKKEENAAQICELALYVQLNIPETESGFTTVY